MKKLKFILISIVTLTLVGCSGSETYRGKWKATNENGAQIDIVFSENEFSIIENGNPQNFEYSQHSVNIENSVETYGIKIEDGRRFHIHFPIANDESKGDWLRR